MFVWSIWSTVRVVHSHQRVERLYQERSGILEERGLVGIEARDAEGEELGRISEVVADEASGEVTHVVVERGEENLEVPIARLVLDPEADFATVSSDASDAEPGDHAGDEVEPEGYAPAEAVPDDERHEGQFVTEPEDPSAAGSPEDLDRESGEAGGWEDEEFVPDSGYPRTDAYIDPETGETTEGYPEAGDARSLEERVEDILEDTGLRLVSVADGVVELAGNAGREELDRTAARVMELEEVFEVGGGAVETG